MKLTTLISFVTLASFGCGGGTPGGAPDASGPRLDGGGTIDSSSSTSDGSTMSAPDGSSITATVVMPRISAKVPAFSSGNAGGTMPSNANDDDPDTSWVPDKLPAWIAYDVSSAPAAQRQSITVAWNALHAGNYLNTTPPSGSQMPTDYTIEVNAAAGGTSAPPTTGWKTVATVSGNLRDTVESPVALAGGNWVRMSITGASDPQPAIDLDVYSTPNGVTDAWMLMGDSITYIAMGYAFSNLPSLVNKENSARWPQVINAAIGGTNTGTAALVIDDTMMGYPGRYVALAYGTNDHPDSFDMETLVKKVIAAGKVPVVPHMPWQVDETVDTDLATENAAIDALYVKYSQIVRGPDLWATFMNHPEYYPDGGGPHPNSVGATAQRQAWADAMSAVK